MSIVTMADWFYNRPEAFLKCVPLMITGNNNPGPRNNSLLNQTGIPRTADATISVGGADASQIYRNGELIGCTLYDYAIVNSPVTDWADGTWKEFA